MSLPRDQWSPGNDAVCVWTCGCCDDMLDEEGDTLLCRTCGAAYDPITGQVYEA